MRKVISLCLVFVLSTLVFASSDGVNKPKDGTVVLSNRRAPAFETNVQKTVQAHYKKVGGLNAGICSVNCGAAKVYSNGVSKPICSCKSSSVKPFNYFESFLSTVKRCQPFTEASVGQIRTFKDGKLEELINQGIDFCEQNDCTCTRLSGLSKDAKIYFTENPTFTSTSDETKALYTELLNQVNTLKGKDGAKNMNAKYFSVLVSIYNLIQGAYVPVRKLEKTDLTNQEVEIAKLLRLADKYSVICSAVINALNNQLTVNSGLTIKAQFGKKSNPQAVVQRELREHYLVVKNRLDYILAEHKWISENIKTQSRLNVDAVNENFKDLKNYPN